MFTFTKKTLALTFVLSAILIFWLFELSNLQFRDDFLLTDPALTSLPSSPIDFFLPNSEFHKAWSLSASFIWLFWKLGFASLTFYKCLCIALHILNFYLLRSLANNSKLPLAYLVLIHPALFLTLSWAYQFTTLLSLTLALIGWLALERSTTNQNLKWPILSIASLIASLFVKPWAVVLVGAAALISLRRLKRSHAILLVIVVAGFLGRSWYYNFVGPDAFIDEVKAAREFESGSKPIDRPPFTPQVPPLDLSFGERVAIRAVYLSNTATTYSAMLLGIGSFSACHPRPTQADINFVVGTLIIFSLLALALIQRFRKAILWLFAAWLPVSGLFYIPQMKISFMSPHYAITFLPGFVFLLEAVAEYLLSHKIFTRKSIQVVIAAFLIVLAIRHINLYWRLNQTNDVNELASCMVVRNG